MRLLQPEFALTALLWIALPATASAGEQPLPVKTDIPADFSTTICPDADKAVEMLNYITVQPAPHNHIADTDDFFAGLAVTGCTQDDAARSQPITITRVLQRKTLTLAGGEERHIAYAGRDAGGRTVYGVVDESANDRAPRSPLEKWLANQGSTDGTLTIAAPDEFGTLAYACASSADAQAVVRSIAPGNGVADEAKDKAFIQALKVKQCLPATGQFRIRAVLEERTIGCGHECEAVWTALEALDSKGAAVGLIYDASLM